MAMLNNQMVTSMHWKISRVSPKKTWSSAASLRKIFFLGFGLAFGAEDGRSVGSLSWRRFLKGDEQRYNVKPPSYKLVYKPQ